VNFRKELDNILDRHEKKEEFNSEKYLEYTLKALDASKLERGTELVFSLHHNRFVSVMNETTRDDGFPPYFTKIYETDTGAKKFLWR